MLIEINVVQHARQRLFEEIVWYTVLLDIRILNVSLERLIKVCEKNKI